LRPVEAANGWNISPEPITSWRPSFSPTAEQFQQFTKDGRTVGVYIAYYRNQRGSSRLVSTENTLALSNNPSWKMMRRDGEVQTMSSGPMRVRSALLVGQSQRLATREWYWVDGRYTGSLPVAAALVLGAKLAGRGDDSAAIITYTPVSEGQSAQDVVLDAFASDITPSLSRALEATRAER
jgi:EpsI family protein